MPNKNFIKLAKRQMNKEAPVEKTQPVSPVQQSPLLINNVSYSFLEGDFGRQVLEEYNQIASKDYQGASALNVLSFDDNVVKGSNPFAFVLLNKILTQQKMRIATPADLEKCLEKGELDLKGTYGDSGLVFRSNKDPNKYLGIDLLKQIVAYPKIPFLIPLAGLDLRYDSNSPKDLSFQLIDNSQLIYAPQLEHENNQKKFNKADGNGLPIFDSNGSRTLYTGNGGLRRLCRDWDLDLDARDDGLADSYSNGRVVVCAEGTSRKK